MALLTVFLVATIVLLYGMGFILAVALCETVGRKVRWGIVILWPLSVLKCCARPKADDK